MSLLLLFQGAEVGPVNADINLVEVDDTLAASTTLDLLGNATAIEADDVAAAAGAVTIAALAEVTEADDALASSTALAIVANFPITEADDIPSASGTVDIVGLVSIVEADDTLDGLGAIGIEASLSIAEGDDTLSADALTPIWYPRRGGDDDWARYEQHQIKWEQQLRRIIDRSWQIAHGEIDPVTFLPISPPDYSAVVGELTRQTAALDLARAESFIAEREKLQGEEATVVLLLAA